MQEVTHHSDTRERMLAAAERLFANRGYDSVTLRDIAAEIGIRHTSLYHHAPGGKEELFIEVTERNLKRHRVALHQAITQAQPEIQFQLYAIADWLVSQPPMDLIRMTHSDMPAISEVHANRLAQVAFDSIISPVEEALEAAKQRGEIDHPFPGIIAGGLIGMIEALHAVPTNVNAPSLQYMAHVLIDALLNGIRRKP